MSWGGAEFSGETAFDSHLKKPGMTYVAGAGDIGGQTLYPSASQYVLSVGGTKLNRNPFEKIVSKTGWRNLIRNQLGKFVCETGWTDGGGGPSIFVPMPTWQTTFGLDKISGLYRATPDVAFNADMASGVAIYDSTPYNGVSGWLIIGGTSLAAPCWAGIIACINGARIIPMNNTMELLYRTAGRTSYTNPCCCFFDITEGKAGTFFCTIGWDFVTGLGSPNIRNLIRFLRCI